MPGLNDERPQPTTRDAPGASGHRGQSDFQIRQGLPDAGAQWVIQRPQAPEDEQVCEVIIPHPRSRLTKGTAGVVSPDCTQTRHGDDNRHFTRTYSRILISMEAEELTRQELTHATGSR